jgi:NDP-sugar pyrophosphorylase family protein
MVVDAETRLLGTITDGDIRRWILDRRNLDAALSELLDRKRTSPYAQSITAPLGASREELLTLMRRHVVRHVPLLDESGRVVSLVTMNDMLPSQMAVQAVIMAGGFGKRLRPLTTDLPKPMLPVGGRPIMEHIIEQMKRAGISKINVTTHFMPEKIIEYFGDGRKFGVEVSYLTEETPLGTAGALRLLQPSTYPLLVINGDILTEVDFHALYAFHREHNAVLTIGVRQYDFQVPYGVVENEGLRVLRITEKPSLSFFVNAGIYLLDPAVNECLMGLGRLDMPELVEMLIARGRPVVSFPIREYWLDIGRPGDYEIAQQYLGERRRDAA